MKIDNIELSAVNIVKAIKTYYPSIIDLVQQQNLYEYLLLFGIRVSTCNTAIPDDILGGLRLEKSLVSGRPFWNMIITEASVDPSPYYLKNKIDRSAKDGTAWVKEGQYLYKLRDKLRGGYPVFAPIQATAVYRWMPRYEGEKFDPKKAKLGTSIDTLIHRSYGTKEYYKDSAGCQIFKNNGLLWDLQKWAKNHIQKYQKQNSFTYTLLTKEQFVNANSNTIDMNFGQIKKVADVFRSNVGKMFGFK
jgi:hypothetical protein